MAEEVFSEVLIALVFIWAFIIFNWFMGGNNGR